MNVNAIFSCNLTDIVLLSFTVLITLFRLTKDKFYQSHTLTRSLTYQKLHTHHTKQCVILKLNFFFVYVLKKYIEVQLSQQECSSKNFQEMY